MKKFVALCAVALFAFVSAADAKTRHYGACDGIHRCRCGSTQTAHFGFPRIFNGHNLWRAVEWVYAFPRTTIHVGVVGYVRHGGPSGHVFRVVSYSGGATATVADDAGTYERRIAGAIFVDPNGNRAFSAKQRSHRGGGKVQITLREPVHDFAKGAF